ncbi:hypothetical protein [Streptomyces echinatus]|uniref:Uncharacterized protein n=1 Tax=Streptomyces echinatus TaxID=67293 RepID=A0A7W9UPI5_9ACTN|nr:hypothetical protein [Streptomyces echinatus]MBB5926403.1 hypothetical protein [Streptomyces echinatus]
MKPPVPHLANRAVDPALMHALAPGLRWLMVRKWPACAAAVDGSAR